MDPLTLMMMLGGAGGASGGLGGGGEAGANTLGNIDPMGGMKGIGSMLSGVKAPEAPKPQFSGGVSGSQLPFKPGISDLLTPAMTSMQQQGTAPLPTLGALLAAAPGGGA